MSVCDPFGCIFEVTNAGERTVFLGSISPRGSNYPALLQWVLSSSLLQRQRETHCRQQSLKPFPLFTCCHQSLHYTTYTAVKRHIALITFIALLLPQFHSASLHVTIGCLHTSNQVKHQFSQLWVGINSGIRDSFLHPDWGCMTEGFVLCGLWCPSRQL